LCATRQPSELQRCKRKSDPGLLRLLQSFHQPDVWFRAQAANRGGFSYDHERDSHSQNDQCIYASDHDAKVNAGHHPLKLGLGFILSNWGLVFLSDIPLLRLHTSSRRRTFVPRKFSKVYLGIWFQNHCRDKVNDRRVERPSRYQSVLCLAISSLASGRRKAAWRFD
jgi:hypothetical protein